MTKQACTKVVSLVMTASTEAYNIDAGTQFKIVDRLRERFDFDAEFGNKEEGVLIELLDWLAFEVARARAESI